MLLLCLIELDRPELPCDPQQPVSSFLPRPDPCFAFPSRLPFAIQPETRQQFARVSGVPAALVPLASDVRRLLLDDFLQLPFHSPGGR